MGEGTELALYKSSTIRRDREKGKDPNSRAAGVETGRLPVSPGLAWMSWQGVESSKARNKPPALKESLVPRQRKAPEGFSAKRDLGV